MSSEKNKRQRKATGPSMRGNQPQAQKRKSAYGAVGEKAICVNALCKLRREGCRGFEGCPGYKARD